jgi:hypothetical protein
MLFGRLQLVWWWRWAFGAGIYPERRQFLIFRYWDIGPLSVRWYRKF